MGSADSSTDLCECGHTRGQHSPALYGPCTEFCACLRWRFKPALRCTCGCLKSSHMGKPYGCEKHGFHGFVCDHSRCGWKPREESQCTCSTKVSAEIPHASSCPAQRSGKPGEKRLYKWSDGLWRDHSEPEQPTEPPMTPEEEEQAPEDPDKAICGQCYTDHSQGSCETAGPPTQPERRPPYTVAYSVQGHLYEVALSGDATVRAVDGGLVITHHLGPVAGLVQIQPMIKEGQ